MPDGRGILLPCKAKKRRQYFVYCKIFQRGRPAKDPLRRCRMVVNTGSEIPPCVRAFPALDFLLHNIVSVPVNDGLVHPLNNNPVLPLLVAHPADFETVIDLLRGNRADVDRVCQNALDSGEVPDKPPSLRVLPFKLGYMVAQSLLPVPPCGAGDFFIFQPAADAVGAAAVLRQFKNPADDPCRVLVNKKMVFVLRVFAVAERGQTAGKLAGFGFCQVGRMDFLAHIPAIHLVQQRAKRRYLVLNLAVHGIIQSDIPHLLPGEEIFTDMDKTTKNLYGVADNPGTYDGAGIFLFKLAYNFTL